MATTNFFRWQREGFELSFLQLRNHNDNSQARYDVTVIDEGHLVAALYDLSVPLHPDTSSSLCEQQCVEAVINYILNDDSEQVTTNWRHSLRRDRLIELSKDLSAWQATSDKSQKITGCVDT